MSQIKLKHSGGNSVIIAAPDSNPASDRTLKLPSDADGTILTTNTAVGKILQCQSTTITAASSSTISAGYYWNPDLKVSITPNNSSNKILVIGYAMTAVAGLQHNIGLQIHRDGSSVTAYRGDAAGSRRRNAAVGTNIVSTYSNFTAQINFQYLDTAGQTSAIEYGVSIQNPSSTSRTVYLNRAVTDTDDSSHYRTASTITVMEVAS